MVSTTIATELRSQWESKREEWERLLGKPDVPPAEYKKNVEKADVLQQEMEEIMGQINDYNEAKEKERKIRENFENSLKAMKEPVRRLPFSAGISTGREGFSTEAKAYEFKDLNGNTISTSERSESKKFILGGRDKDNKVIFEAGDSEIDKLAPTGGFKSLGHFAWCQVRQGRDGRGDPHCTGMLKNWRDLQHKAPSGMFEESDPDGGDLIPREFSNKIYERMMETNQILSYLQGLPLSGNTLTIPALKEDSRKDGFRHGGVLGYWEGEADQYTKTNPKFRNLNLKLHKLTVLSYVTEELLLDSAVALESYLGRLVPKEINFKINDALINGTGGGMPMGCMKANSKVTVGAVSGQGAGTIVYQNVTDMWMRAINSQRSTGIWLYNQDAESALQRLYQATGTAAGVVVFTPNELTQYKLMSRPALVMEQCQTIGTEGDLIFFCPEGWACILKGGLQSFMSMHLRFDYDEFAYKWRFRMDAQPYDDVALSAYLGTSTYSSVVTLNSSRT